MGVKLCVCVCICFNVTTGVALLFCFTSRTPRTEMGFSQEHCSHTGHRLFLLPMSSASEVRAWTPCCCHQLRTLKQDISSCRWLCRGQSVLQSLQTYLTSLKNTLQVQTSWHHRNIFVLWLLSDRQVKLLYC